MPWYKTYIVAAVQLHLYVKVSDYRTARTYIYHHDHTWFIRSSTHNFEILLFMTISANSCIISDMQTRLNLAMS